MGRKSVDEPEDLPGVLTSMLFALIGYDAVCIIAGSPPLLASVTEASRGEPAIIF
jgi:hypothetical protein